MGMTKLAGENMHGTGEKAGRKIRHGLQSGSA
jgi:hypothetical protein